MTQDEHETPVLFRRSRRKEPEGLAAEVTAVFPEEPADYGGKYVTCYSHIGQHGSCSVAWLGTTRPATPTEYANLLTELESIGYRVRVYRKRTPKHRAAFNAQLQAWQSLDTFTVTHVPDEEDLQP